MSELNERRVRRKLARCGLRLEKNQHLHWTRREFGEGYQVVDPLQNMVVFGCFNREYEASLFDVVAFLEHRLQSAQGLVASRT